MITYQVLVATGEQIGSGSTDIISIALIGVNGESPKQLLGEKFHAKSVTKFDIGSPRELGEILLVRLYKEKSGPKENPWCCQYIDVISPNGKSSRFPYYLWVTGYTNIEIPEGKGIILTGDVNPLLVQQRKVELDRNRAIYRWKVYAESAPHCIDAESSKDLPRDAKYSFQKYANFGFSVVATGLELQLRGFLQSKDPWTDLNDIHKVFLYQKTHNSVLVTQMWQEDTFFGYQYLNGVCPVILQKCTKIPDHFPVVQEMVAASLGTTTNLQKELESGNVFLADYKILDGVPANVINGKQQYLTAPLCLLWKNPLDHLLPIAIQLGQVPGPQNPIFLPNDSKWDWTLAKMWVRNAEFQVHQAGPHLLCTHLFAEVFSIATSRQLPIGHPVYKLLVPHFRYTLEINTLARSELLGPGGIFDQSNVTGNGGVPVLLRKALGDVTYSALCLPDNIKARGVASIPNYYYREDGMKVWKAVERLVSSIVNYYYKSDEMVTKDPELQAWAAEVFKEGFLERKSSGIPSSLGTRDELMKYLTMVIFTCSGQHAAVNSGQFDFYGWMPNGPSSMRKPPPSGKGATYQTILDTLPEVNTTTLAMATVWLLSHEPEDKRPLGNYTNERFTEEKPRQHVKEFQHELDQISKEIKARNQNVKLQYLYLDPKRIESSVSI
ncbi:hydroperoxide isomerase ALOXE3-like [Pelobates fuscus]|uniref:hydroperoxide isomerase ALOXE3-like n=1 Tax=Pelobates fuscus TaxID=191477 RepID=UPI002FE43F59